MRSKCNHHSCYPGKRVALKLRDGTTIVGRFAQRDRNRSGLTLEDGRYFPFKDVRIFRVLKGEG